MHRWPPCISTARRCSRVLCRGRVIRYYASPLVAVEWSATRKLSSPRLAAVTWTCSRVTGHLDLSSSINAFLHWSDSGTTPVPANPPKRHAVRAAHPPNCSKRCNDLPQANPRFAQLLRHSEGFASIDQYTLRLQRRTPRLRHALGHPLAHTAACHQQTGKMPARALESL